MYKFIALFILMLSQNLLKAQEITVPAEVKPFVLAGFQVLDYIPGDINGDKKKDALLVLKLPNEDDLDSFDVESPATRPLLILVRQADGKLKQVARNDDAIMCRQCGGVFGDPYDNITIGTNSFTLYFYGGSNWRWSYTYRFMYKPLKKNWYLVKESQSNFNSGDPEKTMKETTIDETELGSVTFENFNNSFPSSEKKWTVKAAKTFFYNNPKIGSTPRKGYLVKGDTVDEIRVLSNFIEISFSDKNGNFSTGFILKKDLQAL